MALQLHRLFVFGCSYGNFSNSSQVPAMMSQCRSIQNYPSIFLPCSPFGGGYKYKKSAELKFRKSLETCRVTEGKLRCLRFTVEREFCLFRNVNDGYKQAFPLTLETQVGVGFSCIMKHITNRYSESSFGSSSSLYKCVGRRFSTVKAIQKSQVPRKLISVKDNVAVSKGKNEGIRSSFMGFHKFPRENSSVVHISVSDGGLQVAVSNQPVNRQAQNTKKSVATIVDAKTKEKVNGSGKKDTKSGSKQPADKSTRKSTAKTVDVPNPRKQVNGNGKKDTKSEAKQTADKSTRKLTAKTVDVPNPQKQVNGNGKKDTKSGSKQTADKSTKKSTAKTVDVANPQKQVNGEVMSDSAVSMTSKSRSKAQGITKQKVGKNKREKPLLSACIPSGAEKTKGSKRTSRVTKPNDPNNETCLPILESIIEGETPLPAASDASLVHHQRKKTTVSSTKKKKSRATKSAKATKKQINGVPVEVNTNLPGRTIGPLYPPSGKSVVVVESVTKAKVIQGYLGDMFEVLPSYGHVRDLAGRSGSVQPDDDFSMVWEVPAAAWTHLNNIKAALNGANNLILASDPDREGEAIAWHITEMLQQQDAVNENITVARVVFHEITEESIKSALQNPRDIDSNLVYAYLARRALDYLIGFNISPLLWRKLPGCQSAGRVQSAALALICDRESEIDACKPQEYWTIDVEFNKKELGKTFSFSSHLTHFECRKLEQLSISSDAEAKDIEQKITTSNFEVVNFKRGQTRKNPPAPYITSTLQQDAANKLHFTSSYTMKLAQKLYEGVKLSDGEATGLITYMRTDGMHVSDEAAESIRSLVIERYGKDFASESTRKYFKKVKNAQEAHEAIRPTSIQRFPSMLAGVLDEDSMKLYSLIWSRTMACQMEPTVIDQVQVDIGGGKESLVLRSTCSRIGFLGYRAVYKDKEAAAIGDKEKEGSSHEAFDLLCTLKSGDKLDRGKVELKQHFTQPPSRYSEGSLVKKLEELGIGRPSTYATTIKVLQDRRYLTVKSRVLYPEFRGRMVSAFLSHHFSEVTDYTFTADMESELDSVSAGTTEWKVLLKDYWARFRSYCDLAGSVDIRQVEKMLEGTFGDLVFASLPDKNRTCPSCLTGTLIFKVSRFGSGYFLGCDQHPKCKFIAKTMYGDDEEGDTSLKIELTEPKVLGVDAISNEKILLKRGPYGFYVQFGEDRKGYLPKRASVSKIKDVESITLEDARELLRYPITLGKHPEDGKPVDLKFARYGFSIKHGRTSAPVPQEMNAKEITLEEALKLLVGDNIRQLGRPKRKPKMEEAL